MSLKAIVQRDWKSKLTIVINITHFSKIFLLNRKFFKISFLMVIFTYNLLCGTIFIPFAVHRPMNPPHSSERASIHRTVIIGKGPLCLSYFYYNYIKICNEILADFLRIGDPCGLVAVRVHAFLCNSRPFKTECTVQ